MKISILTSDHHAWLLGGFFHQWNKYRASEDWQVEVAGFSRPSHLPDGVLFTSIGAFEDYPVGKWSNALIQYLSVMEEQLVMILLEDYWLMRPIMAKNVIDAVFYMLDHPEIIRFDLASDRMYNPEARYVEPYNSLDICECKGAYSLSYQASIFRRELLLEVLTPNETPWESELNGTYRLNGLPYRVVGSYQWPISYMIAMNKGKIDLTGGWMHPARTLRPDDWAELKKLGYLDKEVMNEHAL